MFKVILQIFFLIYIILTISNLLELKKYNKNGHIIECTNINDISEELSGLNPIYFNIKYKYRTELDNNEDLFKNKGLLNGIYYDYSQIKEKIPDKHLFYNESITFYKGKTSSELNQCFHNFNILSILSGKCKVYLINPKHKKDIINKENTEIKKWAHIKRLEKFDNILIPTNWYYFIETENKLLIHHLDVDNYFTIVPNFFKERFKL